MEAWHKDLIALGVVVLLIVVVTSVFTPVEKTSTQTEIIILTGTPAPHFPETPRPTTPPPLTTTSTLSVVSGGPGPTTEIRRRTLSIEDYNYTYEAGYPIGPAGSTYQRNNSVFRHLKKGDRILFHSRAPPINESLDVQYFYVPIGLSGPPAVGVIEKIENNTVAIRVGGVNDYEYPMEVVLHILAKNGEE
jgi:hypothetical protein